MPRQRRASPTSGAPQPGPRIDRSGSRGRIRRGPPDHRRKTPARETGAPVGRRALIGPDRPGGLRRRASVHPAADGRPTGARAPARSAAGSRRRAAGPEPPGGAKLAGHRRPTGQPGDAGRPGTPEQQRTGAAPGTVLSRQGRPGRRRPGPGCAWRSDHLGAASPSATIGRPACAQAPMPPLTLTVSQPCEFRYAVTRADRPPDRQIT